MMPVMSLMTMAWLMLAGVLLDLLLGETRRWHPLVGFGRWANAIERRCNRGRARFWRGLAAWALAVLPLTTLAWWLLMQLAAVQFWYAAAVHALLLYFCIGLRSLREHALPIAQALAAGDLPAARRLTARIVSRDTSAAEETDLAKAGVESLLENGNDAVFGTLFWFLLAGGPGAVLFRLSNTLDAMWGYRTPRYQQFGCAAARIDDVLNWLPPPPRAIVCPRPAAVATAAMPESRLAYRPLPACLVHRNKHRLRPPVRGWFPANDARPVDPVSVPDTVAD